MIEVEGVRDNIRAWMDGTEKLDVFALYDLMAQRFGPDTLTNYLAYMELSNESHTQ